MKKKQMLLLTLLLLGTLLGREAQAFYNPSTGRWLSRDPMGDEAFVSVSLRDRSEQERRHLRAVSLQPTSVFVGNTPINGLDLLGLDGTIPGTCSPWGYCWPKKRYPCDEAIAKAKAMMGNVSNDARAHCVASCQIAKACGKWVCKCLGNAKEARDLSAGGLEWVCSWVLPKKAKEWLNDHIQGGDIGDSAKDFEANDWGMGIAKSGGDCVEDCEARYGPEP